MGGAYSKIYKKEKAIIYDSNNFNKKVLFGYVEQEYQKIFGENVRRIRKAKGMTQVELANLCDVERGNMTRIEKGNTNPTLETMRKIAKALNVPVAELVKDI